ncbi:MAG: ParB N-terminal domain-containing protein, partial [Firmicutes bacterium]|nr:ParB N-terminal domain-containing protein [Bacillota bacterium]
MIRLVAIDAVQASDYNPRRNDEERLALVELSLRKLGFLLPIYADKSGEILSGHQRQLVARRLGFEQVPV